MGSQSPIPLDLVLSGRDLTEPRLSPNGESIGFVHRSGPVSAISVVPVDGSGPERLLTFGAEPAPGRGFGGGCWDWLPTSSGLVYCGRDGALWEIDGARSRQLMSGERPCRGPAVSNDGAFVVVVIDEAEVWMVDRATGATNRLDDGRHEFCFDPAVAPDSVTVSWIGWSPPSMPWDVAERVDAQLSDGRVASITTWRPDGASVQQARFAPDRAPTCVHDASGWLNVTIDGTPVRADSAEHAGPSWGMGQRSYAVGDDGAVVVARNVRGVSSLTRYEPDGRDRDLTDGFVGTVGQLSIVGPRIGALRSGPTTPPEVVVIDEHGETTVVATGGVRAWADVELADPEPVDVEHDGLLLHARHHRAATANRSNGLLCWVHGGPTDQWSVDFRPRIAYWCSRGWDVLVVDPRGTTGHGRRYQRELNGKWGRLDVDDAAALIRHAHRAGWSTPATTVVIGGSSGGLTALGLLADHPDLIAGGIASYPVSDLVALAEATHRFEAHYTDTLVGPIDAPGARDRFQSLSPIHRADRIRGPLLLLHGTDDPVVPIAQSDRLVESIRNGGGQVEYVVYEGEGHGFRDPVNVRDEYERLQRFLDAI